MMAWLLFGHLLGVVVWIGGMFFVTQCLHPTLQALPGPERVKVIVPTLGRFFGWVTAAVVLIWLTGVAMIALVWPLRPPVGWHLMITAALVMTGVYAVIRLRLYPRLPGALAAGESGVVAATLARIRQLVLLNLGLGIAAIAGVTLF